MIKHIVMWKFRPGTETEARAFLEFLRTPGAGAVLESVGFTPLDN